MKKVCGGGYLDIKAFQPLALLALRNVNTETAFLAAVEKVQELQSISEWNECWAAYMCAAEHVAPHFLPNMVGHMGFVNVVARSHKERFLGYDHDFRAIRNLGCDHGWKRKGNATLDAGFLLLGQATAGAPVPLSREACIKWNQDKACAKSPCPYDHVCKKCGGSHKEISEHGSKAASKGYAGRFQPRDDRRDNRRDESRRRERSRSPPRQVYSTGLPDPKDVSPYVPAVWASASEGYPDAAERKWVLEGISEGFKLGFTPGSRVGKVTANSKTLDEHMDVVIAYLKEEVEKGSMCGPFSSPPLEGLHRNRIKVIPKPREAGQPAATSTTDDYRLIVDLSYPYGKSINDGIPDEFAKVSYTSLGSIIDKLIASGPDTLLGKIDFKRAYRQVPVAASDRWMLGIQVGDQWWVDLTLPFGGRSCARIFNIVGDVAAFAFQKVAGETSIDHYLDDFISLGSDRDSAAEEFQAVVDLAAKMGIPLSEKKLSPPGPSVCFLGFLIDAPSMSVSLPDDKRLKYGKLVIFLASRKHASQEELLSVAGKLIHVSVVLPQGKAFLRSFFDAAHSVARKNFRVNIKADVRQDLRWWGEVLQSWVGTALLCWGDWVRLPDTELAADSSGSIGMGIVAESGWCSERWPQWDGRATNIAILELIPLIVAASLWGEKWARKKVLFRSDNMATVHAVNSWLPKDRHLTSLLRRLATLAVHHNFQVKAAHIPGVVNTDADDLSRDRMDRFLARNPSAAGRRVRVSRDLLVELLTPPK